MPRNLLLTWFKPAKCWKKKYNGRVFYVGKRKCKGKTDRDGYAVAWQQWLDLKDRLDNEPDFGEAALLRGNIQEYADYGKLAAKLAGRGGVATADDDRTIRGLIDRYVSMRRGEAESGQLSVDSYKEYKIKLDEFAAYCVFKRLETVDEITSTILAQYREFQLHLAMPDSEDENAISPVTARKRLGRLKTWLEWCYENEALDTLPRNLKTLARIKFEKPRPKFWTAEECRNLFQAATPRTKLYILLGLNCGFTQKDLSTLDHSHIDYKAGEIRRERNKTGIRQVHCLWPLTLKLLRAEVKPAAAGPVLKNENGGPLITETIRDNGHVSTTDCVKLAFNRLKKQVKLGEDVRGFACFRKTSANAIAERFEDDRLVDLFLAHSDGAMRKHYTEQHYKTYFEAVQWLADYFDLERPPKARRAKAPAVAA